MKTIKYLQGHRWFIWTVVFIVVSLVGLAVYIWYTSDMGSNQLASFSVVLHKQKKQEGAPIKSVLLSDFVIGKKFTNACEPGEWGILLPNETLPMVWLTEGGISKPQKNHTVAEWKIVDNQLVITGSSQDDGVHGGFSWQPDGDGNKYLNEYSDNCGIEIGDGFEPGRSPESKGISPLDIEILFKKNFPTVEKQLQAAQRTAWQGKWGAGGYWTKGNLIISDVTSNSFNFKINAQSGGDTGEISGTADIVSYNLATAKVADSDYVCNLNFIKNSQLIGVETSGKCNYFAGAGVWYDGEYKKGEIMPPHPTVEYLEVLSTTELQAAFTKLVGKDLNLFTESAMIQSDEDISDNFPAKAVSGAVAHLYTVLENIIMVTDDGKIWAGVIDPDAKIGTIKYFTNVRSDKKTPPETIQNWIDNLGYKIIYVP